MRRLIVLIGLVVAMAVVLPDTTQATSFIEVNKVLALDANPGDEFGKSVAVSGETAIVGAWNDNGGGFSAGAAYVLQRDRGGADNWGEVKKLTASDAEAYDRFGSSAAISGDTALVGSVYHDAGGVGAAGAAYVFQRNQGGSDNWGEVKKLTASDAEDAAWFGSSAAVSGDTGIVGAPWAGRTDGNASGAAYVFLRSEGGADNWGEVKKLTASNTRFSDQFGISVAISGDIAVVGAWGDDAAAFNAGAAYVFERDAGGPDNWGEVKKLTASDAEVADFFGTSVAVSGNAAVVGARIESAGGAGAGAAYVFLRNKGGAGNWGEASKLTASDAQGVDHLGQSVAISGDTAVVGADGEDSRGDFAGATYVFQRDQGGADNWGEVKKLTASDAQAQDFFGHSVALDGGTIVVGAWRVDVRTPNTRSLDVGAAYIFEHDAGSLPLPTAEATDTPPPVPTATPVPTSTPVPTATTAVAPGDANCDGTVDAVDAALILQFSAELLGSLPCAGVSDVNNDGVVNPLDAALILQFAAGLLDSLPP